MSNKVSINAGEINSFNDATVAGRWTVAAPNTDPGRPFDCAGIIYGYLDVRIHSSGTWIFQEFKSTEAITGVWRRQNINATGWTKWEHSATAEEYDVPLAVARGGTGVTAVGGTDYTTVRFRGSGLRSTDTNPTANGTINWTYG